MQKWLHNGAYGAVNVNHYLSNLYTWQVGEIEAETRKSASYPIFRDWLSYVLAIIACCGIHWVLTRKSVKNRLSQLCDCPPAMQESGNRKQLIYSETVAVVVGILCILFLRKAIFKELYLQGIDVSENLHQNITAFLLQTLVALLALFSVVSVLIQWIYEYYTAQRIRMNQKADGAAYEKLRRCSDRRIQSAGVS